MVLAPGCYDALGARLVEEAGFTPRHEALPNLLPFDQFLDFIGPAEIRELEDEFRDQD